MNEATIILGMHRSGTSCLTGCLSDMGLNLGEVSNSNIYNTKGNQENLTINKLNESILKFNGAAWFNPPKSINYSNLHSEIRDHILYTYNQIDGPWAIKDPRMLFTYEFWKPSLPVHNIVGTFRHPRAVAKSLAARKKLYISEESGLKLWAAYNEKLLHYNKSIGFPLLNFDEKKQEYLSKVRDVAKHLKLSHQSPIMFFENELINQQQFTMADCPEPCLQVYNELLKLSV